MVDSREVHTVAVQINQGREVESTETFYDQLK